MYIFASPLNNVATTLALNYTAGSGTFALPETYGATINSRLTMLGLPSISATAPLRFTITPASAVNAFGIVALSILPSIYEATGLSGDDLTGVTIQEGTTDKNYQAGDIFQVVLTAGQIADIQAALQAIANIPDGVLKGDSGTIEAAVPGVDYVAVEGVGAVTTFETDGSIVVAQDDGLVIVTTFETDGSIVTTYGAPLNRTTVITFEPDGSIVQVNS